MATEQHRLAAVAAEQHRLAAVATERWVGGRFSNRLVTCNSRGVPPVTRITQPDVLYSVHGRKVKGRAKSEALDKYTATRYNRGAIIDNLIGGYRTTGPLRTVEPVTYK